MSTTIATNIQDHTLTPLPTTERPNIHHIVSLQTQCVQILSKVPSSNGTQGHIDLVCRPNTQDWNQRTNSAPAWVRPQDPGPIPIILPNTTQIAERNIIRRHEQEKADFQKSIETEHYISSLLVPACGIYINGLKHHLNGFTNVTALQIITHLYDNYGQFTDKKLEEHLKALDDPYDPDTEQIEVLFTRMENTQQIAAPVDPISDATMLRKSKITLENTGKFTQAIKDWNLLPSAQQTWPAFKSRMTEHYLAYTNSDEYKKGPTTIHAGYNANQQPARNTTPPGTDTISSIGAYCWTHGFSFNPAHTSALCRNKSHGHQDQATLPNMMGGNARIQRKRNDPPVYQPPVPNPNRRRENPARANRTNPPDE